MKQIKLTRSQITGLKAGLGQVAQGCLTLIKVLSMAQVPETDKHPDSITDEKD